MKTVSCEHCFEFILERPTAVMPFLISYVIAGLIQNRFPDANSKIFMLPLKLCPSEVVLIDPVRRLALQELNYLGNSLLRS